MQRHGREARPPRAGALAYYGVRHVAGVEAIHARSRIPFGLFLAPAIWLGWLLEALLDLA